MGHIKLVVPVVHIWYFKSLPNKIGYLLGTSSKKLETIIYYERFVVIQPGIKDNLKAGDLLTEDNKKPAFDSTAGKTALELLQGMAVTDKSVYLDTGNGNYLNLFNSGKISTWIEGQDNSGAVPSQLTLQVGGVSNVGGGILAAQNLDIQTGLLDNRQGTLGNAQGSVTLQVRQLNNVGGSVQQQGAAGQLNITASGAVNNSSGKIEAQGHSLRIEAGELANNSGQLMQTARVQAGQSQCRQVRRRELGDAEGRER